jgi:GT2 family glycosyltransferase
MIVAQVSPVSLETLAIVIPSKNRAADIERALRTIRAQQTRPDRIIVIDQSDQPYDLPPGEDLVHHYDPGIPGSSVAKNVGIALTDCAIVVFMDDDVEVTSDVVALIRESLRERSDAVGVECDVLTPLQRTHVEPPGLGARLWKAWQGLFWRGFFSHGFVSNPRTDEVERVHGCAMAFRSSLFKREQFDQQLTDYSYGEDWEFSKRARRHGRLYRVRGATIIHHESPVNRYGQRRLLEQRWQNMRYFYRKLSADRGPTDALWLWWWMLGETIVWLLKGYGLPRTRGSAR